MVSQVIQYPMFLAAVADQVKWDKSFNDLAAGVDTFLATGHALEKRGLIVRKPMKAIMEDRPHSGFDWKGCYTLTPAGEAVCSLIKMAGIWEEQTAAMVRRKRA